VTVSLAIAGAQVTGGAGTDTLAEIENLTGSAFNDSLIGDGFANLLSGLSGIDTIFGAQGNDTLNGNDGNDTLFGGLGIDTMLGGNGSDTFRIAQADGPTGGETIDGGAAGDRLLLQGDVVLRNANITSLEEVEFSGAAPHFARFAGAQAGGTNLSNFLLIDGVAGITDNVRIDMLADTAVNLAGWTLQDWTPGGPDSDRVRIFGDADNEVIRGTGQMDVIDGGNGNNLINGHLGSDLLSGGGIGLGIDRFLFDTALGPANIDRVADFEVNVDEVRLENTVFVGLAAGNLAAAAFRIGASAADASDRIVYNAATGALLFDQDGLGGVAQQRFATLDAGLALDNLDFLVT
jgi:serralysin